MMKRIICMLLTAALLLLASGCARGPLGVFTGDETATTAPTYIPPVDDGENEGETNDTANDKNAASDDRFENPFISAEKHPTSEVSLNPSLSSYYYFRNLVNKDYTLSQLQKCSYDFNTEEFLNYFGFYAPDPVGEAIFGVGTDMFTTPWNEETALLRLSFNAKEVEDNKPTSFVFHIDVTESMAREDVLPLFKEIFVYFAAELEADDIVSVILCSAEEQIIVDGYTGEQAGELALKITDIEISNGTSCSTDLSSAYYLARKNYIDGGNNRVIIVSDGDVSNKMLAAVESGARDGIITSVLGLGNGNHNNKKLQRIAEVGNGRYFYIDCKARGEAVMGREIFEPTTHIADNVKLNVHFSSLYVSEYRLIGYVYHGEDDGTDIEIASAGKIYSGDKITVCYEVKFTEDAKRLSRQFFYAELSYDNLLSENGVTSQMIILNTTLFSKELDENMVFASCVIKSIMILQKSEYIGKAELSEVLLELDALDLEEYPDRAEFRELIRKIVNAKK